MFLWRGLNDDDGIRSIAPVFIQIIFAAEMDIPC